MDKNLIQRTISGIVYIAVIILCTTPFGAQLLDHISPGLVKQQYLYYGLITFLLLVGTWECIKIMKFGDGYEKWVVLPIVLFIFYLFSKRFFYHDFYFNFRLSEILAIVLETVVEGDAGTGKAYQIEGYHVAGKTGTAQKYDPNTGKIMEGHYIASFIGFAPKDNPRLLVYVVVDDPTTDEWYGTWGKMIIAPIFKSIMERSLQYLQQQPDIQAAKAASSKTGKAETAPAAQPPVQEVTLPKFVGMSNTAAQLRAKQDQLTVSVIGTGTKVVEQYPAPYEKVATGSQVVLVTDRVKGSKMPDFTGKSLRDVMEFGSLVNIPVKATGAGFVASQSIPPGTVLGGTEKIQVTLRSESEPPPANPNTQTGAPEGQGVEDQSGTATTPPVNTQAGTESGATGGTPPPSHSQDSANSDTGQTVTPDTSTSP